MSHTSCPIRPQTSAHSSGFYVLIQGFSTLYSLLILSEPLLNFLISEHLIHTLGPNKDTINYIGRVFLSLHICTCVCRCVLIFLVYRESLKINKIGNDFSHLKLKSRKFLQEQPNKSLFSRIMISSLNHPPSSSKN